MTDEQRQWARDLSQCTFLPGSQAKRFVREMAFVAERKPALVLTTRQHDYLSRLRRMYRKQIEANQASKGAKAA